MTLSNVGWKHGLAVVLGLFASAGGVVACSALLGDFTEGPALLDGQVQAQGDGGPDAASLGDASPLDAATSETSTLDAIADAPGDALPVGDAQGPPLCEQTPDDAGTPAVLIASGQTNPEGMTVDGTNVYWVNEGAGSIVSCPLSGCPVGGPTVLASGQNSPNRIAVDGTSVYWVDFTTSVQKCPLGGCGDAGPTVYAPGTTKAAGLTIDHENIYWTEIAAGIVASCPLAGCLAKNLVYGGPAGPAYGVAVDPSNIYWVNVDTGTVNKAPITGVPEGGAPTILAMSPAGAAFLAMDSENVYWTNEYGNSASVYRAALEPDGGSSDGGPVVLASGLPYLDDIVVDSLCGTVYWAARALQNDAGADPQGTVYRCATSGCNGKPTAFAPNQQGPFGVAQDNQYVYWTNYYDGTVWKRHK